LQARDEKNSEVNNTATKHSRKYPVPNFYGNVILNCWPLPSLNWAYEVVDSQLKNSAVVAEHIPACRNGLHIALTLGSPFRTSIHEHFISLLTFKNVIPFSLQIPQTIVQQTGLI
jgi:hypothetical protein